MKMEDLQTGMAFETVSDDFCVIGFMPSQNMGAGFSFVTFYNQETGKTDWRRLDSYSFEKRKDTKYPEKYLIRKVYEMTAVGDGWELVWEKTFRKADLKSGMHVILRNGNEFLVILTEENEGYLVLLSSGQNLGLETLSSYTEDLLCTVGVNRYLVLDIMEVYKPNLAEAHLPLSTKNKNNCLWRRNG